MCVLLCVGTHLCTKRPEMAARCLPQFPVHCVYGGEVSCWSWAYGSGCLGVPSAGTVGVAGSAHLNSGPRVSIASALSPALSWLCCEKCYKLRQSATDPDCCWVLLGYIWSCLSRLRWQNTTYFLLLLLFRLFFTFISINKTFVPNFELWLKNYEPWARHGHLLHL